MRRSACSFLSQAGKPGDLSQKLSTSLAFLAFRPSATVMTQQAQQMQESKQRLRNLLEKEARVATELVDFMMKEPGNDGKQGLGLECISDFKSFFTEADYQDGVVTEILSKVSAFQSDRIQRGRLRTAWELAAAEWKQALVKKSVGETPDHDWDAPLDPDLQKTQTTKFEDIYRFSLEPDVAPCDPMFGRDSREFGKRIRSLYPLTKVRSAAQVQAILATKKSQQLGDGISIVYGAQQHTPDTKFIIAELGAASNSAVDCDVPPGERCSEWSIENRRDDSAPPSSLPPFPHFPCSHKDHPNPHSSPPPHMGPIWVFVPKCRSRYCSCRSGEVQDC